MQFPLIAIQTHFLYIKLRISCPQCTLYYIISTEFCLPLWCPVTQYCVVPCSSSVSFHLCFFISKLCHLLFTVSPGQLQMCQTARVVAWITVTLQGLTSMKMHPLPPTFVSHVYPVTYSCEDLLSYLMAEYLLCYPSAEGRILSLC